MEQCQEKSVAKFLKVFLEKSERKFLKWNSRVKISEGFSGAPECCTTMNPAIRIRKTKWLYPPLIYYNISNIGRSVCSETKKNKPSANTLNQWFPTFFEVVTPFKVVQTWCGSLKFFEVFTRFERFFQGKEPSWLHLIPRISC